MKTITTDKYTDTEESAFERIATGLRNFRGQTEAVAALILEARVRQIWRLKYSSFREFCEVECGFSRQWCYMLIRSSDNGAVHQESVKSLDTESEETKGFSTAKFLYSFNLQSCALTLSRGLKQLIDEQPVESWPMDRRMAAKAELKPIADIYAQL